MTFHLILLAVNAVGIAMVPKSPFCVGVNAFAMGLNFAGLVIAWWSAS